MDSAILPKFTAAKVKGNSGVNRLSSIFNDKFGWVFRAVNQEHDFGIDAFVDIVNESSGVTGKTIALQIKHGKSYFKTQSNHFITYYGENAHLNYYHNCPEPVIIVLSDPNGKIYWRRFEISEIEQTPAGWKIEVPKTNILTVKSRDALTEIAGAFEDAYSVVKQEWAAADQIRNSAVVFYRIDEQSIRKRNPADFIAFVERLMRSKTLAKSVQGKLELMTEAYDNDPRELWEIPTVKRWVKAADAAGIPWLYLCGTKSKFGWLNLYINIMLNGKTHSTMPLGRLAMYKIEVDSTKLPHLLEENMNRLFSTCNKLGIPEEKSFEINETAYKFLQAQIIPQQ